MRALVKGPWRVVAMFGVPSRISLETYIEKLQTLRPSSGFRV